MLRLILFLCAMLAAGAPQAAELGASLSGDYYLKASAPAGWYIVDSSPMRYHAAATLYITEGALRFELQPYLSGDGSPALAGAYAGVGVHYDAATVSLFHHSCHNLDATAWVATAHGWSKAPPCNFNGINLRVDLGRTFPTLW